MGTAQHERDARERTTDEHGWTRMRIPDLGTESRRCLSPIREIGGSCGLALRIRVYPLSSVVPLLLAAAILSLCGSVSAQTDYARNQYSTNVLAPPDYETFRPPAAGNTFRCPVFGTEILVLTDDHSIIGFNGERSNFSQDDNLFFVGAKPPGGSKETRLYDGRTGAFIKALPIPGSDNLRWSYHPKTLVELRANQLIGHDVVTGKERVIKEFREPLGNGKGRVCGGDGHDFDDKGEWILLEFGAGFKRLFAYNIRTGRKGREFALPQSERHRVDYATISPSGQYVVANGGLHGPKKWTGAGLYRRDGRFLRHLGAGGHCEFGYLNGTGESCIMKAGKGRDEWRKKWDVDVRERYAVQFSDGKVVSLSLPGSIFAQYSAVGGSNRRYLYLATESDGMLPNKGWNRYHGEIIEIPLDGSKKVRRLLHHRARPDESKRKWKWGHHTWEDQPELWVNHAGDRLFFRSNMCLKKGTTGQRYGHDLFMIKIPPRRH